MARMRKLSPLDMMKILLLALVLLGFISIIVKPSLVSATPYGMVMDFAGVLVIHLIQSFSRESNGGLNLLGLIVGASLGFLSFMLFLLGSFLYAVGISDWAWSWYIGFLIIVIALGYIFDRFDKSEKLGSWRRE